jgi:NADH-ubiquinone oxidoreductase chain 2
VLCAHIIKMVVISLMILIIAIALTSNSISNTNKTSSEIHVEGISPILFIRLTSIVFIFSGALSYNALYIQSIGSGISIYSGLYHVTVLSQSFDLIIYILASLILIPWSNNIKSFFFNENDKQASAPSLALGRHTIQNPQFSLLGEVQGNVMQSVDTTKIKKYSSYFKIITKELSGPKVKEYSLIVLFSTLGSSLLLSSCNLLSLYLSLELQSFGVYILASIYRDSESSTNAGLKYFLLGGLSSCIILLGCVLIYSYTGLINFEDINSLLLLSNYYNGFMINILFDTNNLINLLPYNPYVYGGEVDIITIVQLGLILIFIGFLFKIAAAPFHNWAPDVYNDVPSIVTTWLTIMPKIAIIILTLDIINIINLDTTLYNIEYNILNINLIKNLLLISSFLSLIIGTIVGLAQTKIKRLLAYSTISHIGFILLALSVNTEESLESVLFYIIQYSFTNLNIFFIILAFGYILKNKINNINYKDSGEESGENIDINFISELKGQFKYNPLLTLSLAISLFSMAGIPPLLGFFAKAGVLYSSTQNGYYFISLIAIIVSVISAYYYLAIIKVMHFDDINPNNNFNKKSGIQGAVIIQNSQGKVTNIHSFIIAILTLSILLFILKPSIILNSIHLIALNIFYF